MDMALARLLADGKFHSGEMIGAAMGISRAAVWSRVGALREIGITVHSVPGKGYRVPGGIDLLDVAEIRSGLPAAVAASLDVLEVVDVVASTNDLALSGLKAGRFSRAAIFAEQQISGRGRRGRNWISPFAANIYLSVTWEFPGGLAAIDGLSLAIGVAVCDAIRDLGVRDVGLKWPNDLVVRARKCGGILIEVNGDISGSCAVVVGIGLNVDMRQGGADRGIDQPWTDLRHEGSAASRNEVARLLLSCVLTVLGDFAQVGLPGYLARWREYDVVIGHAVDVSVGPAIVSGIAAGIDEGGALIVETGDGRRTFHGGEVSVREGK